QEHALGREARRLLNQPVDPLVAERAHPDRVRRGIEQADANGRALLDPPDFGGEALFQDAPRSVARHRGSIANGCAQAGFASTKTAGATAFCLAFPGSCGAIRARRWTSSSTTGTKRRALGAL